MPHEPGDAQRQAAMGREVQAEKTAAREQRRVMAEEIQRLLSGKINVPEDLQGLAQALVDRANQGVDDNKAFPLEGTLSYLQQALEAQKTFEESLDTALSNA